MTVDERGFDSNARSFIDLSLEDLQAAFKELVLENSKLTLKVRALETENQQIRMFAGDEGVTTAAICKVRQDVVIKYLVALPAIKKKRGRPTLFKERANLAELYRLYELREDKSIGVKPWLKALIEADFSEHKKVSLTSRKAEIKKLVQSIATQMTRYKSTIVT